MYRPLTANTLIGPPQIRERHIQPGNRIAKQAKSFVTLCANPPTKHAGLMVMIHTESINPCRLATTLAPSILRAWRAISFMGRHNVTPVSGTFPARSVTRLHKPLRCTVIPCSSSAGESRLISVIRDFAHSRRFFPTGAGLLASNNLRTWTGGRQWMLRLHAISTA